MYIDGMNNMSYFHDLPKVGSYMWEIMLFYKQLYSFEINHFLLKFLSFFFWIHITQGPLL